jgi:hypothetical protein
LDDTKIIFMVFGIKQLSILHGGIDVFIFFNIV